MELEPKVSAVGAGLDIFKPFGNMVIDIGGGTSDETRVYIDAGAGNCRA